VNMWEELRGLIHHPYEKEWGTLRYSESKKLEREGKSERRV
jgi:hypothetical protein